MLVKLIVVILLLLILPAQGVPAQANENANSNDDNDDNIENINDDISCSSNVRRKRNVRLAIDEYGARRIGHGYRIVNDPELIEYCKRKKIHFEMCPTSSYETGGWDYCNNHDSNSSQHQVVQRPPDWTTHPLALFDKKYGITNISIYSDDPAVFHTSLSWQYRIALCKMKQFTRSDFIVMNVQALDAAFGLSNQQRIDLQQQLYCFAKEWGIDIVHTNTKAEVEQLVEENKVLATETTTTSTNVRTTVQLTGMNQHDVHESDQKNRKLQQQQQQDYDTNVDTRKTFETSSPSIMYRKAQSSDSIFRDRVYIINIKM
jgi:Adenosine deaminase